MICPDPWPGGEWHLYDIVDQMYLASLSLLDELASDPKAVLKRMAIKAKGQIQRGEESEKQAYIIPKAQHDVSALRELLLMMKAQCVEFFAAEEDFYLDGAKYEKGTIIVPLAQPNYALVETMLGKNPYPYAKRDINPDGSIKVSDTANLSIALCMGIKVFPAMEKLDVKLSECEIPEINKEFPLSAKENASFREVNNAFKEGKRIFRDEQGDFYREAGEGRCEIKALRTGLLKKSATWNEEEGYTRNILKNYNFDFDIVMDKEIRENGVPEEFDVIIIPGDDVASLLSGDLPDPTRPIEHKSGLGAGGAKALLEFVNKGGRLVVWEKSCKYAVDLFKMELCDLTEGLTKTQFMTAGSQLAGRIENDSITLGMPNKFTLTHSDGPVYKITGIKHEVETIAWLADKDSVYVNGLVKGEEILGGTPAIMRAKFGLGEVLLYTFNPEFRFQQNGTYKLLFNALYEEK